MKKCKICGESHKINGNVCRICKDGLYRYNMNRLDMLKLFESQNKKCYLCDKEMEMFSGHKGGMIDHDHETGKVRSILCNRCNTVVGGFESHTNKKKLLDYLGV
jgi:hypothetical protein